MSPAAARGEGERFSPMSGNNHTRRGNMRSELEALFDLDARGAGEDLLRHGRVLAYRARTIRSGNQVEVECWPVYKRAYPDARRQARHMPTSEAVARVNDRRAEKRFNRLAECNFSGQDIFLTLTYNGDAPREMEQAIRDWQNFVRRVNRRRKRQGLEKAKYMAIIEQGDKNGRAHHHALISGGLTRDELEDCWGKGYANADRLKPGSDGLKGVCRYMLKRQGQGERAKSRRRYLSSRGLTEPRITESTHRVSRRQAAKICEDAEIQGEAILRKAWPGLDLLEFEVKRSDWVAGAYIYARFYRAGWQEKRVMR